MKAVVRRTLVRLPVVRSLVEVLKVAVPYLPVRLGLPDGGSAWRYLGDNHIPRLINEIYNSRVYESLPGFEPKEGETVLDIGAHIGLYSLQAAQRVGPKGMVVAVEADPRNFHLLSRNAQLSGSSSIVCKKVALWSRPEDLVLHRDEVGFGGHSVVFDKGGDSVHVKAETLDSLVERLGLKEVSLMKMDVEGAALQVLQGARDSLARWKPRIVCAAYHTEDEAELLANFLQPFGYRLETRDVRLPHMDRTEVYLYAVAEEPGLAAGSE